MNKKIIFSLIILIVLCTCGTLSVLAGLFLVSRAPFAIPSAVGETLPPSEIGRSTLPTQPLQTPLPAKSGNDSVSSLPVELALKMDEIQLQVSDIRGLQANQSVARALLTQDDLQHKVETEFFKDYTADDAEEDVLVLSKLGLLPEGFDILGLYKNLYAEQIAGYYDSETKEMYVVQGEGFTGIERMTYAHEYTHTLQDQAYDLEEGLKINEDYCENETEYCSAVTALVEGDAVFTEQEWLLKHGSEQDQQEIQDFYLSYSSPVFDSAPMYLQKDFLFPYLYGLEFVYSLNDQGGYALVDQAFQNPPVTTEQILHPDKYPVEKPVEVSLPDIQSVLPETWKMIDENELGEWYSYLVLAHGREKKYALPEITARAAAAGWGGDQYALFADPTAMETVFILRTEWDTENDALEFILAMKQYGENRWGDPVSKDNKSILWTDTTDGSVYLFRSGSTTTWLIVPDETIRQTLQTILPDSLSQ